MKLKELWEKWASNLKKKNFNLLMWIFGIYPGGYCPVQAEGYFLGYYYYFRSRWNCAYIEFAKDEKHWENNLLEYGTTVYRTEDEYKAGWLNHSFCVLLVVYGMIKFINNRIKTKLDDAF